MLNRTQEEKLKVSLTEAMSRWLEEVGADGELPYLGDGMAETMAAAAFAPLRAVADAQEYLERAGMLKDD